ncbi:MAG: fimbrillin family protein [Tannerella sp.]|jgi:hypothetical protein|nr:fimbrillin family protein [Tannerella sp.]
MKKIFILLSIFLSLCVLTNSCIYEKVTDGFEEETDPPVVPPVIPPEATKKNYYLDFVTGEIEGVDTYAVPEIDDSPIPIMWWRASDEIGVFMKGDDGTELSSNKKYELPSAAAGKRVFTLKDSVTTSLQQALCYGYTPYKTSVSDFILSNTLNSVQDQSVDSKKMDAALNDNVLMIAPASPYFKLSQTGTLQFENVFAFLRFQVTQSSSFASFNFQKITGVKLYVANENEPEIPSDDYALAGDYRIDVSKAPSMPGYTGPEFTSGVNSITATVTGGNNISTSTVSSPYVWFVVNPLEIKPNERLFSFVKTTSGFVIMSAHVLPSSLKANNVYTFNIEARESNTVSDQVVVYYSDQEASNCYIIPRAGVCQIPLKTITGADLRGDTVEWLWASKEGGSKNFDIKELIDPASLDYNEAEGYVRFRVGTNLGKYTKGNVILALKDASNEIVWTWHIWITDQPEDVEYDKSGGNPNIKFLDRNIGALSADTLSSPAIDTYGFVYQWGRKDPFIGGNGVIPDEGSYKLSVANEHTKLNPKGTWGVGVKEWDQADRSTGTIEESVKYPMRFIYNGTPLFKDDDPADWLSVSQSGLWSDERKTDYDPCPSGYKVPGMHALELDKLSVLYRPWQSYDDYVKTGGFPPAIWFYNAGNSNRYWEYYNDNTKVSTMWPTAGMRQGRDGRNEKGDVVIGAQLKYSGTDRSIGKGYYWTSTPHEIAGPGASYRIEMYNTRLYSPDTYGPNADAYSVRCVKIDE